MRSGHRGRNSHHDTTTYPIRQRIGYVFVSPYAVRVDTSTPAPVLSRRRTQTRTKLLDAARDVFAERGVVGASVEEICERAGFTRGAFYSNFEDKDQLIHAVLDREEAAVIQRLTDTIEHGLGDDMDSVTVTIERFLDTGPIDRQFFLFHTELAMHAIRDPQTADLFLNLAQTTNSRIAAVIESGMAALGRELTVSAEDAADAILAIVDRSNRRSFIEPGRPVQHSLARTTISKVLTGLSRPLP